MYHKKECELEGNKDEMSEIMEFITNPRGNDLSYHFITWRDRCTCGANNMFQLLIFIYVTYLSF